MRLLEHVWAMMLGAISHQMMQPQTGPNINRSWLVGEDTTHVLSEGNFYFLNDFSIAPDPEVAARKRWEGLPHFGKPDVARLVQEKRPRMIVELFEWTLRAKANRAVFTSRSVGCCPCQRVS